MIGTWKWKKEDYAIPLIFPLDGAIAHLLLDAYDVGKRDRDILWNAKLQLRFSPPPPKFIKALKSKTGSASEFAEKIYSFYQEVLERFESVARTAGNMKNLMNTTPMTMESFFNGESLRGEKVTWHIDNETPQLFNPKFKKDRRRINPLFKMDQLVTKQRWTTMQVAINNADFPTE